MVTAGPTHEAIDPVRYLGNRSTGKMGFAVAKEAAARGAQVVLISGPVALGDPPHVQVVRVESAEEMAREVLDRYPAVDAVVMAAAVADWRPTRAADSKLKKEAGPPKLSLVPTADILSSLGHEPEAVAAAPEPEAEPEPVPAAPEPEPEPEPVAAPPPVFVPPARPPLPGRGRWVPLPAGMPRLARLSSAFADTPRMLRLLAAQGALAPRAQEQLALLVLLSDDPDPEIRRATSATLDALIAYRP